jgi:archaellum component FlaC
MRRVYCLLGVIWGVVITLCTETFGTGFDATCSKYNELAEQLHREKDPQKQQLLLNEILQYAKILLGVVDTISFAPIDFVQPFCERLQAEAKKIGDSGNGQPDPTAGLKIKRDVNRLNESAKFLMMGATLLGALYKDRELLPTMVSRIQEDVPHVAREITTMLYIVEMIIKDPADIESPVKKMIELSSSAEDGTYLLSRIMTYLMSQSADSPIDFRTCLSSPDFPGEDKRAHLTIR